MRLETNRSFQTQTALGALYRAPPPVTMIRALSGPPTHEAFVPGAKITNETSDIGLRRRPSIAKQLAHSDGGRSEGNAHLRGPSAAASEKRRTKGKHQSSKRATGEELSAAKRIKRAGIALVALSLRSRSTKRSVLSPISVFARRTFCRRPASVVVQLHRGRERTFFAFSRMGSRR